MQRVAPTLMFLVAFVSGTAHADEPSPPAPTSAPHLAVSGTLGLATPLGLAGIELEAHVASWLRLSAGVGLGASGVQVAVMPRAAVEIAPGKRLYIGAGVSAGRYTWHELLVFDQAAEKTWKRAYWLNGELGVEKQLSAAWSARLFLGMGAVLNDEAFACNSDHCSMDHQGDGARQLFGGFAFARSLR